GDGWSLRLLAKELSVIYNAGGHETALSSGFTDHYERYVIWLQQWMEEKGDAQLPYWIKQLAHLPPPIQLPTDRSRQRLRQFAGGVRSRRIADETARSLDLLCRQQGVTKFMVCYAALTAWLQRCTRVDDVVLGTVIANRRLPQWETTFGYFGNPVALRLP